MADDIHWRQRFQNYEMTFELAWKLMKDYLELLGYTVNSPRDVIKQALQATILEEGQLWMDALSDRNLTTHTYDENKAIKFFA